MVSLMLVLNLHFWSVFIMEVIFTVLTGEFFRPKEGGVMIMDGNVFLTNQQLTNFVWTLVVTMV